MKIFMRRGAGVHASRSTWLDRAQVHRRMLAQTLSYNALQRNVVPGIVDFYRHLTSANPQPESAPIIYLSASPRQLHTSIDAFLTNQFVPGVLITKRVTDDRTSEPLADQVSYKTAKIEAILESYPGVIFTVIGDDGDFDPEIYADIAKHLCRDSMPVSANNASAEPPANLPLIAAHKRIPIPLNP